ncbi:hypothetical protein LTR28_010832, partial [Elasticomyces elasticus]
KFAYCIHGLVNFSGSRSRNGNQRRWVTSQKRLKFQKGMMMYGRPDCFALARLRAKQRK